MFKTKKSRIPAVYRILLVAIAVMAIGGIAVNCYVGNYYRADSIAEAAIDSDREVAVTIEKKDKRIQATQYDLRHKNYTITFAPQDKEKATKALIFYPGGRVQYTAYAPLMHELAKNNFVCILVHMPGNLAVLDQNAADGIIEKYKEIYPSIQEWYMGGHSLGGAMAAEYVSKHVDEFDGLYLFAAYSTADLSDSDLRVLACTVQRMVCLIWTNTANTAQTCRRIHMSMSLMAGAILILEAMVCKRETVHLMWLSRSR